MMIYEKKNNLNLFRKYDNNQTYTTKTSCKSLIISDL